jgi:hypothetical protein
MKCQSTHSGFSSLQPGPELALAAAQGHPVAQAIVESWKLNLPILHVRRDDPLWSRIGDTTFDE